MMEYISKQLAVEELENLRQFYEMNDDCDELVARKCKNAVAALPVADVVPVVRCQECKHLNIVNDEKLYAHCPKTNTVFLPFQLDTRTHFCSLGKRKADNQTEK